MSLYRYLVFGAGRIGTAVIYDLVKYCNAQTVWVREPNEIRREKAQKRLQKLLGSAAKCIEFFHPPHNILAPDCTEIMDCIISCAPYMVNDGITRLAIDSKIPMVDLGGNPEMVAKQQKLVDASDNKTLLVSECGASPGISNMFAAYLADMGYKDIEVRCGGILNMQLPYQENYLNHKILFNIDGLLSEYYGVAPVIRGGKLQFVPARTEMADFQSKYGDLVGAITSNNSFQSVQTLLSRGVENYDYMTLRYPNHWSVFKHLEGGAVTATEAMREVLSRPEFQYDSEVDSDILILRVTGKRGDSFTSTKIYEINIEADKRTKFSAMELMSAWGITIVARTIALHKQTRFLKKGFFTPEKIVDFEVLLAELQNRIGLLEVGVY
jgi:saccharopine dehydrogenase-like NADP-dependent oxidoreductase